MTMARPFTVLAIAATLLTISLTDVATAQNSSQVCIAIVLPSVQGVEGNATTVATEIRDLLASFLTGPSVKAIALDARLPSQATIEARQKGCGQVLIPAVVRTQSGGGKAGKLFGQAAGIAVSRAPVGGGATGAVAAGAAAGGGHALYYMASETKKLDELELTYRLGPPDAVEQAKAVSSKAKAKADGEDLLTPLVEKAANTIVSATTQGAR